MTNFKRIAQFTNGLTKEDVRYNSTSSAVKLESVITESDLYKEYLINHIDNRVSDIDKEYSYRMHRVNTVASDEIQLTPWVKGGRL